MAYQPVIIGASGGDGTGEPLRNGGVKIDANFSELYGNVTTIQGNIVTINGTLGALGSAANQPSSAFASSSLTISGHALTGNFNLSNTDISGLGTASVHDTTFFVLASTLGQNSGVATLDSGGKVPTSQLPAAIQGALNYQGAWNASTNTPTLTSSVGTKGFYYTVNVAGTTNLDSITQWNAGDHASFNGTVWEKLDGLSSEVLSFGPSGSPRTGAVVATTGDYTTAQVTESGNLYYTNARAIAAPLTGYASTTGTITSADTVLTSIEKLNGNLAIVPTLSQLLAYLSL